MATPINLYNDYRFILNSYSCPQIDVLIENMEVIRKGYQLLYVIDTYDIVENYLPYTQVALFSANDKTTQAQKFICYDYFFGGINNTMAILLNEYQVELFAAKNKLTKHLRDAKIVLDNLDSLKEQTKDLFNEPEKMAAFVLDHFEVILLLLILNEKNSTIFEEFFSFLRSRLNTSTIPLTKKADREQVEGIFIAAKPTALTVDIFKTYVALNNNQLISIENADDRHIFLENTFRDIKAIERVLQVNSGLEQKQLPYKVIYLSSAKKTADLYRIVERMRGPATLSTHFNIYQFFLLDRIRAEFPAQPERALNALQELRQLLEKTTGHSPSVSPAPTKQDNTDLLSLVRRIFDERSGILDNHFYITVYDKYKTTFKRFLSPGSNAPINGGHLQEIIRLIDNNRKTYLEKISSLDLSLSQLNQTYDIVDTFRGLDDFDPDYRSGIDAIKNPYQHLPVLFLIDGSFNSPLKDKLYKFLNTSIELSDKDRANLKQYLRDIVSEASSMEAGNLRSAFLKSIIITYINLVAQTKSQQPNEGNMIIDLEKHYEIIKIQFSRIDLQKTLAEKQMRISYEGKDLLAEVMYLLIWLYRRCRQEDEGIHKGVASLHELNEDARILQGIGLCYVSKAYQSLIQKKENFIQETKDNVDLALQYLRRAQEGFKMLININSKNDTTTLIIKNYIAILNSAADMYLRKYALLLNKEAFSLIELARELIEEIKTLFNTIDLLFEEHPTYVGTEMEIEYYEALHYYHLNQISSAHQKISRVNDRYPALSAKVLSNRPREEFMLNYQDIKALLENIVKINLRNSNI